MKNSDQAGLSLLLLGSALLLVQALPGHSWPANSRLLAIFSDPMKGGTAAEKLAWREWQDHGSATRTALRASR